MRRWLIAEPGDPRPWSKNLLAITAIHARVTGILAGFSVTWVVLLATTFRESKMPINPHDQATVGLFLVAFFGFVGTAIVYTVVVQREGYHSYFLYSVGSTLYHFSAVLAFLGVYSFVSTLEQLPYLRGPAFITMLCALFGGYAATAIAHHDLMRIRSGVILIVFGLGIAAGVLATIGFFTLHLDEVDGALAAVLYLCCGLIMVLFTSVMLTFFWPETQYNHDQMRIGALIVLLSTMTMAVFLPGAILLFG